MKLSLQIARGLAALALGAAASAYALTGPVNTDAHEVAVAHSRLSIETLHDAGKAPRYQVASVRVGAPIAVAPEQTRRMVMRAPLSENPS